MSKYKNLLYIIVISIVLLSCGGKNESANSSSDANSLVIQHTPTIQNNIQESNLTQTALPDMPIEQAAAIEWLEAVVSLDGNRILKYTCLQERDNIQEASAWLSALPIVGNLILGQKVEVAGDVSDVIAQTVSLSKERAIVKISGELRIAVSATADAKQLDEEWQLVYENNTWRWCGSLHGVLFSPVLQENNLRSIAFPCMHDHGSELCVINSDGSNFRQLTNTPEMELTPKWSSNGKYIAYTVYNTRGSVEVYLLNIDSGNTIQFGSSNVLSSSFMPAWSPDGEHIAFLAETDLGVEIVVANTDGTELKKVTKIEPNHFHPSLVWSPDGRKIIFTSRQIEGENNSIYVISLSDGVISELISLPEGILIPLWSPNGTKIAFTSYSDTEYFDKNCVHIMNADGSNHITIAAPCGILSDWSPDGQKLSLTLIENDMGVDSYIINLDKNEYNKTSNSINTTMFPVWSPDGQQLAFLSTPDTSGNVNLYVASSNGDNPQQLTTFLLIYGVDGIVSSPIDWSKK